MARGRDARASGTGTVPWGLAQMGGGGERKCSNMLPGDLLDGYQVMNDLICVPEFCPEFRFFEIA